MTGADTADKPFVYVFKTDDRDKMLENGYRLLKADDQNNIFIFEKSDARFEQLGVTFILSNTLTFG